MFNYLEGAVFFVGIISYKERHQVTRKKLSLKSILMGTWCFMVIGLVMKRRDN